MSDLRPTREQLIALAKRDPEAIADLVLSLWSRVEALEAKVAELQPPSSDKRNFANPPKSKLELCAGLSAFDDVDVAVIKAEDLVLAGYLASADNAFVGLFALHCRPSVVPLNPLRIAAANPAPPRENLNPPQPIR